MRKRAVLASALAAGFVFVLHASPVLGAKQLPAANVSTCVECCEADAVCQALAGLADLRATVDELVPQQGLANSLEAKLDAATSSVLDLRVTPALNQLDAFGNEVDAAEQSGRMSASVSNVLKTKHDTVKNSISNVR